MPMETLQNVRDLSLAYDSEPEDPVSIVFSFDNLERFEFSCSGSEDEEALVTLHVDDIAASRLKVVKISDFTNQINLFWFSVSKSYGMRSKSVVSQSCR